MKKILTILAAMMMLLMPMAFSDSATMTVNVGNTAPTVDNLVINSINTGATVAPNPGAVKTVSVEAEASDENGHGDISSVSCAITGHGTITLSAGTIVDPTTRTYTGSFDMNFYDDPSTYEVTCTATDASAQTGNRMESFAYQTSIALELDAALIGFADMSASETKTITGDNVMTTPLLPSVQNYGNVQIDAEVTGTDLTDGGKTIAVGKAEFRFGVEAFADLSTTTQTAHINMGKAADSIKNVDFKLTIPEGTLSGSYSGTVTITAVSG